MPYYIRDLQRDPELENLRRFPCLYRVSYQGFLSLWDVAVHMTTGSRVVIPNIQGSGFCLLLRDMKMSILKKHIPWHGIVEEANTPESLLRRLVSKAHRSMYPNSIYFGPKLPA